MEEKNLDKHFLFDNNEIQNLESKLVELRLNGQTKISQLKDEIDIVKTNKFSDKNQKREEISSLKAQLAEARNDKKAHSEEIKTTVKEALKITNDAFKTEYCYKNNIKLIRIPYTEYNTISEFLDKELKGNKEVAL